MNEADSLRFGLRQQVGQRLQRFRMRMPDRDGLVLFFRVFKGQFQLASNRARIRHIIEKRHIAKGAGNAGGLCLLVRGGRGRGAAIDKEQMMGMDHGHEFRHELRIRRRERPLVIVDASRAWHGREHGVQRGRDFGPGHAGTKLLHLRAFVG